MVVLGLVMTGVQFCTVVKFVTELRLERSRAFKDDFQPVLPSLRTLIFTNIINGSLNGMRIDVIR